MLQVIEPGLYSTVQDRGRDGWGHLGVRRAGAADPWALAAANLLVGNPPHAAAVEMTLLGGTFAISADVLVGLAGAEMEAYVPEESRRLTTGASHRLRAGTTLAFGSASLGARTYLALAGAIDVPAVLGSASTDPVAGFGGVEGRALRAGDVLVAGTAGATTEMQWPSDVPSSGVAAPGSTAEVSVLAGPHLGAMPSMVGDALVEQTWTVSPRADRVGLRLDGQAVDGVDGLDLVSVPMVPGAIQVPANGRPIVLMPDAPTVGGYPVPAVIAAAEQHRTGQLRPDDAMRFRWISLDGARQASAEQRERLAAVAAELS